MAQEPEEITIITSDSFKGRKISKSNSSTNSTPSKNILHQICRDGKILELGKIMDNTPEIDKWVNELDEKQTSPLHYAVRCGHLDIVKRLLSGQIKNLVNRTGPEKMTPLHFAARYAKNNFPEAKNNDNEPPGRSSVTSEIDYTYQDPMVEILSLLLEAGADMRAADEFGLTPLHHAAMRGSLGIIQMLLKTDKNKDVTKIIPIHKIKDIRGSTPLHIAATYNKPKAICILKGEGLGIDLDIIDNVKETALHRAAKEGNLECANLLIANLHPCHLNPLIEMKNREGCTAFILSVASGNTELVKLLLDHDKKAKNVNTPNTQQEYPLHIASRSGDLRIAELLISYGAGINTQNCLQQTPLFLAAMNGFKEILTLLIQKEADPHLPSLNRDTPLMIATTEGHEDCVEVLLQAGTELETVNQDDQNVIHLAAKYNHSEILKKLLVQREDVDTLLNSNDKNLNTPLHLACEKGQVDCLNIILEHNPDIDNKNRDEQTPCHLASLNGHSAVLNILIKKDYSLIFDKDEHYNTSLHLAATHEQPEVLTILLENGAHMNEKNDQMWTALDCACASNALKCVKILMEKNAQVNPIGKNNTTPLHLAAQFGNHTIVSLLLEEGANPTTKDMNDQNALQTAISQQHKLATKAILDSQNWRDAMRTSTARKNECGAIVPDTPMRMLIRTFPDLATEVFDKCISMKEPEGDKKNGAKTIDVDYEFLDDTYNLERIEKENIKKETEIQYEFQYKSKNDENELRQFETPYEVHNVRSRMDNHPLNIMVKQKRKDLLRHPLCIAFLHNKWKAYGIYLFYLGLLHYFTFLVAITIYILRDSTDYQGHYYNCLNSTIAANENTIRFENDAVQKVCLFTILFTVILGLANEISQIFWMGVKYIQWGNVMDCTVYICSSILIINDAINNSIKLRECWEWKLGAIVISISWLNLLQYLRHINFFGIYVIMFLKISRSVLKFLRVATFPIVAVALPLHMLLIHQEPFAYFHYSILKVAVGIVGEYEYEGIFVPGDKRALPFEILSVIFFILWIIGMPIVIVNTIVGLAVDDIKIMRDEAELKKLSLHVEMVLESQKYMPNILYKHMPSLLKKFRCQKESLETGEKSTPIRFISKRKILDDLQKRQLKNDIVFDVDDKDSQYITNEPMNKMKREIAEIKDEIKKLSDDAPEIKRLLLAIIRQQNSKMFEQNSSNSGSTDFHIASQDVVNDFVNTINEKTN